MHTLFCKSCNLKLLRHPSYISPNNFCSKSCAATYNNRNKTYGTRRSKLELYLEQELSRLYPDCDIHFNRKDTVGSELDIYIPVLHLAFELNGIFHYKPIYGVKKLNSIQTNDVKKVDDCLKAGVSLHTIDVSDLKRFTPNSGLPYLNYILDIMHLTNKNLYMGL